MSADLSWTYDEATASGGLLETSLGQLRDELGYKKLGKGILEQIVKALGKQELGYFPQWVLDARCNTEPRQGNKVWVYVRDNSTRARVLDAILCPEQANVRSVLDGLVSGDLAALTAEEKLKRIREIVNV
ncbi:hypothetical protein [Streptomyces himastatinicus]|uniref:hypothetical protein n=1 Tax=Streptomyces himastatinicus TaxID=998084 RepID=UPI0006828F31|nr:hypothetical protein [Streptomyces himastatinicus]